MVLFNILHSTLCPLRRLTNFQTSNIKLNATRTYVRWTSRQPVAIVNEDELYETEDTTEEIFKPPKRTPRSTKKASSVQSKQPSTTDKTEGTKKSGFTILHENDKIISSLMTKTRSRKTKEKNDEIILEGQRLMKEAINAGVEPVAIFFNDPSDIDALQLPEGVKLYKVPYRTIKLWSSLTNSPGLIGIFNTPDVSNKNPANDSLPLTIICDNVRDPGNLGSILRAAGGVGCERLLLMKGCTDLWNPKTLRTAAGTHFQLPIHTSLTWDEIPSLVSEDANTFIVDSNFGNEFASSCTSDESEPSLGVFNVKPESLKANLDTNKDTRQMLDVSINKSMVKQFLSRLPVVPYYTLDYTEQEVVLVLSGETAGLSFDSYKYLNKRKGIRINIPLMNGVNTLNPGVVLGIIVFEMKRQFIKRQSEL